MNRHYGDSSASHANDQQSPEEKNNEVSLGQSTKGNRQVNHGSASAYFGGIRDRSAAHRRHWLQVYETLGTLRIPSRALLASRLRATISSE